MTRLLAGAATVVHTSSDGSGISPPTAGLIAAAVAAVVAVIGLWLNGVRDERARRRALYGEALAAVMEYKEFPYAIRRRGGTDKDAARRLISEELRGVQARLAHHSALLRVERSRAVEVAYAELVGEARRVAGGEMRVAWNEPPSGDDQAMNQPDLDLTAIEPFERVYVQAVKRDLAPWWPWSRG